VTLAPNARYAVDLDALGLTTGYVVLETEGGAGSVVTLTYAESYGGPFTGGKRGKRTDNTHFTLGGFKDVYRPDGKREKYEFFWFRCFRFLRVEVETGNEPLTLWPVAYRETGYPLEAKTAPESSDAEWIAQLWDASLRTLRRCMHETYEDCPYYEQMQYTFDTRLQILFTYYVSADPRLARKTIDDFYRSTLPEGITQSRYPTNHPQVIPTFSISWISMLFDYYTLTADRSVLERYRPGMENVLGWFHRKRNTEGPNMGFIEKLGYWNFIDWPSEWDDIHGSVRAAFYGPSTIQNLMYVYGLETAAKILNVIGFHDLETYYLDEARDIQRLVRERCFDRERGLFREGPSWSGEWTQHAQVWAVLTETVTGSEAADLMTHVLKDDSLIKCTFPVQFYFFRALEKAGLYEKTETEWETWKRFLPLEISTIPETPYDDSRSDCHAWSALLLYEYPAKILGVYPVEPGYQVIGVKPQGLYLGRASGKVCTPRGEVSVSWEYQDGVFSICGSLPEGVKGKLTLPDGTERALEGGAFQHAVTLNPRLP
jgi:hypothetical protein